jgi:hypothetical protein
MYISILIFIWVAFAYCVPNALAIDYRSCNVPMKDGSYETGRCNDLEELCKDWLFYRREIIKAQREGDKKKVIEYQENFRQTNEWLNKYKDADVQNTFSRLGGK